MYKEAEVATLRRQITGGREGSYTSPGLKMSGIERVCLEMEYIPQNWRIHRENDDQPCDFGHIYYTTFSDKTVCTISQLT